ncbi:MAG: hypothetical protein EXS17_00960 [Phycisphaerales bacterium]|nr:hypothetical protein [Phycisphaerales bacterium]
MGFVVDLAYIVAALVTLPIWLISLAKSGKLRTDWSARLGVALPSLPASRTLAGPRILIHAVSVGEVNAIRHLVNQLADGPLKAQVIISVTTNTGIVRATTLYGSRHTVVRFPFDLSWSMRRFLTAVQPDLVLLMELELWPNFTRLCETRAIQVAVINGRLSARSFARSKRVRWLLSPMFRRLAHVCAQDDTYAQRFAQMGVPQRRISVTGTMKWDTADIADEVEGSDALARAMGIDRSKSLVVAGSTAPSEEALIDAAMPAGVQLLCAPRKPEWFGQAARALAGCVRRSEGGQGSATGRFLLDTIGELRMAYALADVVVIGRTFGVLHGSDMMEPAALGKVVVVGPRVDDFQSTADALLAAGGLVQTSADGLSATLAQLLASPDRRRTIATAAREVVKREQGASAAHAQLAQRLLTAGCDHLRR